MHKAPPVELVTWDAAEHVHHVGVEATQSSQHVARLPLLSPWLRMGKRRAGMRVDTYRGFRV